MLTRESADPNLHWIRELLDQALFSGTSVLALPSERGFIAEPVPWQMSLLLKRQIERLQIAIELSTDWLEIQYLRAELDQLKDLYEEPGAEAEAGAEAA